MDTNKKPDITGSPRTILLTIDQVKEFFAVPYAKAQENYDANVALEPIDPEEPELLPPDECVWSLEPHDDMWGSPAFPDFPGYDLHFYDEAAIASFSGGGSDMVWNGDDWEM